MLEYIKMIILSVFCGITAPLPTSSAAHYSILADVMSLTADEKTLGFYFSVFGITFAVVIFLMLRKIYFKTLRAFFIHDKEKLASQNLTAYKPISKNILLSLIPMIVLFVPLGDGVLLIDYFDKFLGGNGLYLTGFASIINALVLVVAMWYTKQNTGDFKRVSDSKGAVRMSFYQLVSYIVPGFSHVTSGGVNMLLCDIHPRLIIREVYLYLAPQMFLISLARLIRAIIGDVIIDLITVAIAVVVFGLLSMLVVHLVGKFNVRKLFGFFSVYSALLGICAVLITFID